MNEALDVSLKIHSQELRCVMCTNEKKNFLKNENVKGIIWDLKQIYLFSLLRKI